MYSHSARMDALRLACRFLISSRLHRNEAIASVTWNSGCDRASRSMLIGLERARSSIQDRASQQFRVPECVGYAVSGQRVLEVSGIADERPAGAVRLPEMPGDTGKATQAADQASATDVAAEMRRVCREDLEEGALDISAKCAREGCARHAWQTRSAARGSWG